MSSEILNRLRRFFTEPPLWMEIVVWIMLLTAIAGIRIYIVHLLPTILWSRDAGSYTASAFHWLHTGVWVTDPRRGPVYSLFIAWCLKIWGNFNALLFIQHLLGGFAVLMGIIVLRVIHGRRAIILIGLCGYAYAVYALPILMEHLVRNETLLFFFATLILVSWFLAVDRQQSHWLWITGVAMGLMQLTKPVFTPFPLLLIALYVWAFRKQLRSALAPVAVFLIAFLLPIGAAKIHARITAHPRPPEPQAGILLYGRTAQFTVLDGGIEPQAKELIRQDILDYRNLPKLDNNVILKQTAVPHLRTYYYKSGRTPSDLNKLCQRLALEGIAAHKADYAKQILHDLATLHFKSCSWVQNPTVNDIESTRATLDSGTPDSYVHAEEAKAVLDPKIQKSYFSTYRHRVDEAWLFQLVPVLLTTLLLPFFVLFASDRHRLWWIGCAAMWYFTLVLLSTIGRPLDRYMLPVVPVIFWTLSSSVIVAIRWLLSRFARNEAKSSVIYAQSV